MIKSNTIKIILVILMMVTSFFTAGCEEPVLYVDRSRIDLSPTRVLDMEYLNEKGIKSYLIDCIINSHILTPQVEEEILKKHNLISFYVFKERLYDSLNRVRMNLWIPANVLQRTGTGMQYCVVLKYQRPRTESLA